MECSLLWGAPGLHAFEATGVVLGPASLVAPLTRSASAAGRIDDHPARRLAAGQHLQTGSIAVLRPCWRPRFSETSGYGDESDEREPDGRTSHRAHALRHDEYLRAFSLSAAAVEPHVYDSLAVGTCPGRPESYLPAAREAVKLRADSACCAGFGRTDGPLSNFGPPDSRNNGPA
jgi:hypothetical protein